MSSDVLFCQNSRSEVGRIQGFIRPSDTAARLGGDEFVVMMPMISGRADAKEVAVRLAACLERPIFAGGHTLNVGASIGISLFPDDGCDAETLLRVSDVQMYTEKSGGRNRLATEACDLDISRLANTLELV